MRWRRSTPERSRRRAPRLSERAVAATLAGWIPLLPGAAALLAPSEPAAAQLLNLDRGRPPQPGEGKALLTLAESLARDVQRLEASLKRSEPDALARDAAEFRLAVRRLAIALIEHAEQIGEPASPHALAAMRIAASLEALDALPERAAAPADGDGSDAAAHLRFACARFAEEIGSAPRLPADPALLDEYLRDRFAMIVQLQSERLRTVPWCADPLTCGWPAPLDHDRTTEAGDLWPAFELMRASSAIDPRTIARLEAFDELLQEAEDWWIHQRTAAALRRCLIDAAAILRPPPDALPESAHTKLVHRFAIAAEDFTDKATRTTARADLETLARFAALLQQADQLQLTRSQAETVRDTFVSLAEAVAAGASGAPARLRNTETAVVLLARLASAGSERDLARELRPGWRILTEDAARTHDALLAALPRLAAAPNAMTDPALAAIVASHRRALDDLTALQTISHWLGTWLQQPATTSPFLPNAPGGPATNPQDGQAARRLAAARVLSLCQSLGREREKSDALTALRAFAADLRDLGEVPLEAQLPRRRPDLHHLTGGRAEDLARHIDATRTGWLFAWATAGSGRDTGDDPAALAAHLRALHALTTALADAAALLDLRAAAGGGGPVPRAEASFGLLGFSGAAASRAVTIRLSDEAGSALPQFTAAAIEGRDGLPERLAVYAREHQAHALIARLHRACAASGLVYCPPYVLAATPRPLWSGAWLGHREADLAAISRYLEEYAHAAAEGENTFARQLLDYVNIRAGELLDELPPPGAVQ